MTTRYSFRNPEMIIAGSALIVSLITAFVSIYSAFIDRAYARASVWPRLEISRSVGENNFSYNISNKGTGPADIRYARLTFDNQLVKSWPEYLKLLTGTSVVHIQSHMGSIVMSAGDRIRPLQVHQSDAAKVLADRDSLSIELCYCSIYDECWLADRFNQPKSVKDCKIDDSQRFLQ